MVCQRCHISTTPLQIEHLRLGPRGQLRYQGVYRRNRARVMRYRSTELYVVHQCNVLGHQENM